MLLKLKIPLNPSEPLLLGVSGGADSVALLDALVQLGYRPYVCHLNHQWRGAESDADAEFVRALAGHYDLPATIESISNLVGAPFRARPGDGGRARKGAPTEDAARQARLAFFESVATRTGIRTLALAHTADDQVETFLLRLLRGAGTAGLVGMWTERQIGALRIVRPLLEVRRAEIIEYLKSRRLSWREDASNADRRFLRNRIRHELLPLLERDYNPGIRDVLLRTAEVLRAEAEGDPIAVERRAIRQLLGEVNFAQVETLRQLAMGDEVSLPGGVIVYRDYNGLKIADAVEPVKGRWAFNLDGETAVPELGVHFAVGGEGERFDADALGDGLFVRTWQTGDRFQPLGMISEKKMQDFFVDEKVPRRQRGRVPLLCVADGRIAWVVGHRIAEPFKVTERTHRVLRIGVRG